MVAEQFEAESDDKNNNNDNEYIIPTTTTYNHSDINNEKDVIKIRRDPMPVALGISSLQTRKGRKFSHKESKDKPNHNKHLTYNPRRSFIVSHRDSCFINHYPQATV